MSEESNNYVGITEGEIAKAKALYEKHIAPLSHERKKVYASFCWFVSCAYEAYNYILGRTSVKSDAGKIVCAGCSAYHALECLDALKENFKCGEPEVFERIDKTSAWLSSRGLGSLPVIVDGETVTYKTASGVATDMRSYLDAWGKYEKQVKTTEATEAKE